MSDLCLYELEDIAWDEFCQSDDHIVPHPGEEQATEHLFQGDSRKKPRHEVTGNSTASGDHSASKYVTQEKEDRAVATLNEGNVTMLDKGSWSHTSDSILPPACENDCAREKSRLACDSNRTSTHGHQSSNADSITGELGATDPMNNNNDSMDGSTYDYVLGNIPQTEDGLSFFDNNSEDKNSGDLLYYGWPEIGNFEDVDRMFRSCDSTFGLGVSNEEELGWFTTPDDIEGSEDVLKSDFKFLCPESTAVENTSENCEAPRPSEPSCLVNDPGGRGPLSKYRNGPWSSEKDESGMINMSSMNGSSSSDCRKEFKPEKQMAVHKKQSKHQNQSFSRKRDQSMENGGSIHSNAQNQNSKVLSSAMGDQSFGAVGKQTNKQTREPDSFQYLQRNFHYMHSDYSNISDQTSMNPTLPAIKCETNGFTSISPKESSYASNRIQSMESSPDPSFQVITPVKEKRRGKQMPQAGNQYEGYCDAEGVPVEVGSSIVPESSSMSSGLDEISLEAASFRQLQNVMEQLDLRTKLCIRDSLYRLARSAEQRHKHANLNGGCADDGDVDGALAEEGSNKSTGYMDIETDTNPIDRSIAHLLFHRPSDPSVLPPHDSVKPSSMINVSSTVSPLMAEKVIHHDETAPEMDKTVADH